MGYVRASRPGCCLAGEHRATRWRSGRDSNPRYAFDVYSLSRRAPSTTRPPLRMHWSGVASRAGAAGQGCPSRSARAAWAHAGSPPAPPRSGRRGAIGGTDPAGRPRALGDRRGGTGRGLGRDRGRRPARHGADARCVGTAATRRDPADARALFAGVGGEHPAAGARALVGRIERQPGAGQLRRAMGRCGRRERASQAAAGGAGDDVGELVRGELWLLPRRAKLRSRSCPL